MRRTLAGGTALAALVPTLAWGQASPPGPEITNGGSGQSRPAPPSGQAGASPAQNGGSTVNDADSSSANAPAPGGSTLDSLEPAESAEASTPPTPPPTGNPILDRLNALEAKVNALEARNRQLEAEAEATKARVAATEVRAAKDVQFTWGPSFSDPTSSFTFKPRGMLQIDYAGFKSLKGGYDFNNGTLIRRGRFGFDGTAFKNFAYRIEAEYVNQTVNLLDAYVAYTGFRNLAITIGQQKTPTGLEANSSDAFNEFMERGTANVAFGSVGGERRVGATVAYVNDLVTATVGVFGAGEAVNRNATTPDEVYSANARVTVEPINTEGRVLHLGGSFYKATDFAANTLTFQDRPEVRVDGGYIESVAIAGTKTAAGQTGAKDATFYGLEGAGVFGPASVQAEYSHMTVDRFQGPDAHFDGWYAFGTLFLTGESRSFKNGVIDRVKPLHPFNPAKGDWGAFELAGRYERLNLTDHGLSALDHDAHSITGALNWYLNGNVKVLFNYIRFTGENSPLVITAPTPPVDPFGTTAKGEAFATRLHLDF